MSQATTQLLQHIQQLQVKSRKNVTGMLAGNYATTYTGSGMVFREARKYAEGDPIQHIDWNMTARLGEPYVRTYHEEREREIFLAIDISPSMYAGYQQRNKIETAIEIAATLAFSAVQKGDKLGYLLFSNDVYELQKPRSGKLQLHRFLKDLVSYESVVVPAKVTDPRLAIKAIESLKGHRFVVFLISDFIDHDVPDDLRYVRRRHDVSLIHIYDPFEFGDQLTGRPDLILPVISPENGRRAVMNRSLMNRHTLKKTQTALEKTAAKYKILIHSMATNEAIGLSLAKLFERKRSLS